MTVLLISTGAGFAIRALVRQRFHRYEGEAAVRPFPMGWTVPATALSSAVTWLAFPTSAPAIVPIVYVLYSWVMVLLAAIDLDVHRLPNSIQLPAYPVLLVLLACCSLATDDWARLLRAVVAGVALLVGYLLLALLTPAGALGLGDVKLAGLLGLLLGWLGWAQVVVATFATFLLGGFIAVGLLLGRRARLQSTFAYGPPMILGALLAIAAPLIINAVA